MGSSNPFGGEGSSINRPPLFNGEGYAYWKVRMKIFIQAIDIEIWQTIEKGPHVPKVRKDDRLEEVPIESWTEDDKKKVAYDYKAKNIITSALSYDEFFRVSQCSSAKQMWDTLQVTHEGTNDVRRARMNTLTHEYELFRMKPNENISDMQKRFTHIVNHLLALGKIFVNGELANKVLRCLDRDWQPKVTAIMESRDMENMDLATLFGKLQEHEIELNRLKGHEETDKKKKGISLKATTSKAEKFMDESSQSEESNSDLDEEAYGLLVKKFSKFLKRKGNFNRQKGRDRKDRKDGNQRGKSSKDIKCHECGKIGHIKWYCPDLVKKNDKDKSKGKDFKGKRAYIVWDVPEEEDKINSSSSDSDEAANLCLMGKLEDGESSKSLSIAESCDEDEVSSNSETNLFTYDDLYDAYVEMHNELANLVKSNLERKRVILMQQSKISELQKSIEELMQQNDTLNKKVADVLSGYQADMNLRADCEKCKCFEIENSDLKTKLASFTRGDVRLENVLANQRNFHNRSGLGYTKPKKKNFSKVSNFSKVNFSKKPTCFYCGTYGHITNVCKIKMFGIPNGDYMWIVKGENPQVNTKGPKITWVPKKT